ncbi:Xylosyltransferase oxt [Cladobotryum mycophilum]|uniref:Xylosyltransferase oxt n=1 Tax=Cladobotryum mycophilum TaxID=491253 RepID=A0ABR0SL42_9HYPO
MSTQLHNHRGSAWPEPRSSAYRRTLAFSGLLLLLLVVLSTLKLISVETTKLEKRGLNKRQFQLGGILGGAFVEIAVAATPNESHDANSAHLDHTTSQSTPNTTSQPTASQGKATITLSGVTSPTSVDASTKSNHPQSGDQNRLLEALTSAVRAVIQGSALHPSAAPNNDRGSLVSDLVADRSIRSGPDPSPPSKPSLASPRVVLSGVSQDRVTKSDYITTNNQATSTQANEPTSRSMPSIGILGGLVRGSLRSGALRRAAPDPAHQDPSSDDISLLNCLSNMVAEISKIDPAAAARLIDAVLEALHVNSSAVASVVPQVAGQASVNPADMLPLIIPAVANAIGQRLHHDSSTEPLDKAQILNDVLQQGTTIINELSKATGGLVDPALQSVLNQVASIISAAANYLNQPLCAISQVRNGVPYDVIVPCDSAKAAPVTTSNSGPSTASSQPVSNSIVTLVLPSSYMQPGDQTPSPTQTSATSGVENTNNAASSSQTQQGSGNGTPASPTKSDDASTRIPSDCPVVGPCPTCPSCTQCPSNTCSTSASSSPGGQQSPDPSVGPCPGRGFKCADCPDGWFCPPQETPAQAAPCGLGWPCYHCSSGWYCTAEPSASKTSSSIATTVPSSSLVPTSTGDGATPTSPPTPSDLPEGWTYLGCFQDAISRTLLGGKPIDLLRGDMSDGRCIGHCTEEGYKYAGTENGKECWCGNSVRDNAVRLPETQCSTPCQGTEGFCGGNWAISVYQCASANDASYGSVSHLLAAFKAANGSPISPILFLLYTQPIYLLGNRSGRFGYADDTAILRIGNTIEETVSLANADVAELSQWGTENAVSFDPDKTEVMHFARHKKQIQEAPPVLQGTIEKQPEPAMRWLGIWFDSSLCFRAHVDKWATKALTLAHHLRSLTNTQRGPLPKAVRRAVLGCIEPILLYGIEAWYPGLTRPSVYRQSKGVIVNSRILHLHKRLSRPLLKGIRAILPTWDSTPLPVLYRESGILPIDQLIEARRLRFATRLLRLDHRHPLAQRLQKTNPSRESWLSCIKPQWVLQGYASKPRKSPSRLERTAALIDAKCPRPRLLLKDTKAITDPFPSKEKATELLNQWASEARDYLIVYSDGSQLQDSATGWGFVILRDGQLLQSGHGRLGLAEVYDGEIRGALEGLRAAAQIQNGEKITVCIDSTAALTSLMGTPSDSSQAEALAFQELATELRVSLCWCPGHMGIPGNEMADEQAKLGASLPNNNNTITLAAARRIARRKPLTAFQQWWKKEAPASYQRLQLQVTLREPPELSLTRNNLHRLIAARSGHGDFADYYTHKYPGSTATRTCSCGRNKTLDHIFYCRKVNPKHRIKLGLMPSVTIAQYLGPDFERFIKLVNETGFFQKICPRN